MKRWVLDIICCPVCKGNFIHTGIEGDDTDIVQGLLTCTSCKRVYRISSGIANLLPNQKD